MSSRIPLQQQQSTPLVDPDFAAWHRSDALLQARELAARVHYSDLNDTRYEVNAKLSKAEKEMDAIEEEGVDIEEQRVNFEEKTAIIQQMLLENQRRPTGSNRRLPTSSRRL